MKRAVIFGLSLAAALAVVVTGCGGGGGSAPAKVDTPTAAPIAATTAPTQTPVPAPAPTPTAIPVPTPVPTPTPLPTAAPPPTVAATATTAPTATPLPPTATPRPSVGTLGSLSGSAEYRYGAAGAWVVAADGVGLNTGDSVRTGAAGSIAITFRDGSIISLEAGSEVEIQTYSDGSKDGAIVERVARIAVVYGTIGGDIREDLIYPPSVFEIVTEGEIIPILGQIPAESENSGE